MEIQARVGLADADGGVDSNDSFEMAQSPAPEIAGPRIVCAELRLEALPRNQSRLLEITYPEGEPDVEVDGEG